MKVLRASVSFDAKGIRLLAEGRRDLVLEFSDPDEAIRTGQRLVEVGEAVKVGGLIDLTPEAPRPKLERDARGYRVPEQSQPGYGKGRRNPAKGRKFPADPPTAMEVVALITGCPDTPSGRRLKALIALLWRSGLRIHEALLLVESDLDVATGSVTVRRGKGGKRRTVGMQRQLGHSNLAVTTNYLVGVDAGEVLELAGGRTAPMMAAPDVMGLLTAGPTQAKKAKPAVSVPNLAEVVG